MTFFLAVLQTQRHRCVKTRLMHVILTWETYTNRTAANLDVSESAKNTPAQSIFLLILVLRRHIPKIPKPIKDRNFSVLNCVGPTQNDACGTNANRNQYPKYCPYFFNFFSLYSQAHKPNPELQTLESSKFFIFQYGSNPD